MKKLTRIPAVVICSLLLMGGCQSTDLKQYVTPANTRIAVALVCSNTLTFAVSNEDRVEVANYIYAVAHGVRTLAGGKVPTPAELRSTVDLFTPDAGKWVTLGTSISSIYGGIYSNLNGNSKLALEYLEAIASGCEDAAGQFKTP